jgi:MFS family permease
VSVIERAPADRLVRLTAASGLYYGWLVVALALVIATVSAGTRMASGVLIKPLEAEFGWDRAAISLSLAIGLLASGLGAPFGGRLIDRFGPRRTVLGALGLTLASTVGTIFMTSLLQLTLWWGLVLGLGTGALSGVLGPVVASRWFVARRGLVTGLLGGGSSAGQLVFIPLLMGLTVTIDWRAALAAMALLLGLLLPLAWLVMRDEPASVGLEPYGAAAAGPSALAASGPLTPLGQALRSLDFWLLAGSFFVCGFTTAGLIGTHFIPHAIEYGFTEQAAAGALAIIGAMNIIGTLASGYLTDRFNPRFLLATYYGLRAASLLLLPFVHDLVGLSVFAVIFGLDFIATVPPTVALAADRFGKRSLGAIYGWIFFSHQVGSATASWGGGLVRVWFGDYQLAFLAGGALGFIAAALCLRITRGPRPARAPALTSP